MQDVARESQSLVGGRHLLIVRHLVNEGGAEPVVEDVLRRILHLTLLGGDHDIHHLLKIGRFLKVILFHGQKWFRQFVLVLRCRECRLDRDQAEGECRDHAGMPIEHMLPLLDASPDEGYGIPQDSIERRCDIKKQ